VLIRTVELGLRDRVVDVKVGVKMSSRAVLKRVSWTEVISREVEAVI